jgi:hypothetical protein
LGSDRYNFRHVNRQCASGDRRTFQCRKAAANPDPQRLRPTVCLTGGCDTDLLTARLASFLTSLMVEIIDTQMAALQIRMADLWGILLEKLLAKTK